MSDKLNWTEWTDPDPVRIKYSDYAQHLMRNPGKWFVLREAESDSGASSAAQAIRDGRRVAFRPAGKFEAASRERKILVRFPSPSLPQQ